MDKLIELLTNMNFWTAVGAIGAVIAAIVPVWLHSRTERKEVVPAKVKPETKLEAIQFAQQKVRSIKPFDANSFHQEFSDSNKVDDALFLKYIDEATEAFTKERNVFSEIRAYLDDDVKKPIIIELEKFDAAIAAEKNGAGQDTLKKLTDVTFLFRPQLMAALEKQIERLV